ncbi:MAG: class I SAM-dependent methyltransferase [Elusimicrobiota bacterium]
MTENREPSGESDREGAKQPERFNPAKAASLDDRGRFSYLPPNDVLALLDAPKDVIVVDFGTGTGAYAFEMAWARPDLIVYALDEQDRMIDLLRDKLAQRPTPNLKPLRTREAHALNLRGRVDRILAINVLHELGDAALKDLALLPAPSGRALFIDWNADVDRPVGPPQEHVYGPKEAKSRVERFGFTVASRRLFQYHYALICDLDI